MTQLLRTLNALIAAGAIAAGRLAVLPEESYR
jgi:hypothetical protein